MSIERALSWRLVVVLFFGGVMLFAIGGSIYGAINRHISVTTAVVLATLGIAVCGSFGYWLGGPCRLTADDQQVRFQRPIGKVRVFPRSQLAAMVLRPAAKASSTVEFQAHDGAVMFTTDTSFGQANFERFAGYLHVPLRWDVTRRTP